MLKSLSNILQPFHPQNLKIQQWPFLFVLIHVHTLIHVLKNCIITHLHDVHPLEKICHIDFNANMYCNVLPTY